MNVIKKFLILADESAAWELGGLTLLDRMILNIREYAKTHKQNGGEAITVYWKKSLAQKQMVSAHPLVQILAVKHTENAEDVLEFFQERPQEVFVTKTNRLLGRKTLISLFECDPKNLDPTLLKENLILGQAKLFHFFTNDEMARIRDDAKNSLWEKLARHFQISDKIPSATCKSGFYNYWAVVKDQKELSRHERRFIYYLGKPTDGLMGHIFNRFVSCRLSSILIRFGVTPNLWTAMMFLFFLFGAFEITLGSYHGFVIGTLVYYLISILDGCDGEIARVTFTESKKGEWFDTMSDMTANYLFILALGIGLWRFDDVFFDCRLFLWESFLSMGLMALTVAWVAAFTRKRSDAGNFSEFGKTLVDESRAPPFLKKFFYLAVMLLKRDFYAILFFILALLGQTQWILHFLFLGILGHLVALMRSQSRKRLKSL